MAELPKEELLVVLFLISAPVRVSGAKKLTSFLKFTALLFLDHFLNYIVISFLHMNDFSLTPQHQSKISNIKVKGGIHA